MAGGRVDVGRSRLHLSSWTPSPPPSASPPASTCLNIPLLPAHHARPPPLLQSACTYDDQSLQRWPSRRLVSSSPSSSNIELECRLPPSAAAVLAPPARSLAPRLLPVAISPSSSPAAPASTAVSYTLPLPATVPARSTVAWTAAARILSRCAAPTAGPILQSSGYTSSISSPTGYCTIAYTSAYSSTRDIQCADCAGGDVFGRGA